MIGDRDPIYVDALTGLRTRRAWLELAAVEFARSRRLNRPLALVLIDLDHLARVTYDAGFLASDEVLKRLASIVQTECRGADLSARAGGDEFVVLLPEAGSADAAVLAQRLSDRCRAITVPGAPSLAVTCTAGVSEMSPADQSIDEPLARAGQALEHAKGRMRQG